MRVHRSHTPRRSRRAVILATVVSIATVATVLPSGPTTALALPRAAASFRPVVHKAIVGGQPYPIAIADLNLDGRRDIVVGSEINDNVNVLYGRAGGGFDPAVQYPAGDYPFGIAVLKVNADNRPDLAVVNNHSGKVAVLRSKPSGFRPPVLYPTGTGGPSDQPVAVTAADFDRDGRRDLAVANSGTDSVGVLLGVPGGFGATTVSSLGVSDFEPVDVTSGDFNGDGKMDIAVLLDDPNLPNDVRVAVLIGRGNGRFRAPVFSAAGASYAQGFIEGRFDAGAQLDLVVSDCDLAGEIHLLRGRGDGTFRPALDTATLPGVCGYELAAGDMNRDGRLDVLTTSEAAGSVGIHYQRAAGGFGPVQVLAAVDVAYSVAVARLNGDNRLDIVVPDFNHPDVAILYGAP